MKGMRSLGRHLLVAAVTLAAVVGGVHVGSAAGLKTGAVWADNGGGGSPSYHACMVTNIGATALPALPTVVSMELVNGAGTVLGTKQLNGLAPGATSELIEPAAYTGFAWCRYTGVSAARVRAYIATFHFAGTYYDTLALDDAR